MPVHLCFGPLLVLNSRRYFEGVPPKEESPLINTNADGRLVFKASGSSRPHRLLPKAVRVNGLVV